MGSTRLIEITLNNLIHNLADVSVALSWHMPSTNCPANSGVKHKEGNQCQVDRCMNGRGVDPTALAGELRTFLIIAPPPFPVLYTCLDVYKWRSDLSNLSITLEMQAFYSFNCTLLKKWEVFLFVEVNMFSGWTWILGVHWLEINHLDVSFCFSIYVFFLKLG